MTGLAMQSAVLSPGLLLAMAARCALTGLAMQSAVRSPILAMEAPVRESGSPCGSMARWRW
jgi:hypothetical protein